MMSQSKNLIKVVIKECDFEMKSNSKIFRIAPVLHKMFNEILKLFNVFL